MMKHLVLGSLFAVTASLPAYAAFKNNIEAGYSKSNGNTDTENLFVAASSTYDKALYNASFKLKLDQQHNSGQLTKDYRLAEAKAKQFFKPEKTFYGYGNAQWEQDSPAGLQNNWVVTLGPGYQWQWALQNTLSLELGAGYQSTDYTDDAQDYDGSVGRAFSAYVHPLNKAVTFKADTLFLMDELRTRNTSNLTLESALTQSLSLSAGYEYRYNSQPDAGKKKEDTTARLTLKYNF